MSEANIHINQGVGRQFRGMVRLPGHRKWEPAGPWRKSYPQAAKEMLGKFLEGGIYKRGEVWMSAEYYEPIPVLEMSKP